MKSLGKTKFKYKYSICTLVTKFDEYEKMLESFKQKGFNSSNSEFLYIDNTIENTFDGYSGINHFLSNSTSEYVIICHQDCLLSHDDEPVLSKRINELDQKDQQWALAGNAGGVNLAKLAIRITDPGGTSSIGSFPNKVMSLDENFILVDQKKRICLSGDLNGFHLYGSDICIMADILGYNSYVIDFHLTHNGKGNIGPEFKECKDSLISKYRYALRARFIRTTCTRLYISKSSLFTRLFNNKRALNIVRSLGFK